MGKGKKKGKVDDSGRDPWAWIRDTEDNRRRANPFMPLEQGLRARVVAWERAVSEGDKKRERVTRGAVRGFALAMLIIIRPEHANNADEVSILEQQYGMPGPRQNERSNRWEPLNTEGGSVLGAKRKRSPRRRASRR